MQNKETHQKNLNNEIDYVEDLIGKARLIKVPAKDLITMNNIIKRLEYHVSLIKEINKNYGSKF